MVIFFKDLFGYHRHFNQEILELLQTHEGEISKRSIPLISHIINAHQIWNSRILGDESFGVSDVHTLTECAKYDQTNYLNSLDILDDRDLDERIAYKNSKGNSYENSIQEMLFQVVNHTTHHRGQIISDLRASGITPPVTDYIWYKR
ncbi:DinB family protein [Marinoscillum pacificum]|uniref:DinB family protein n=1 Tax=Marinoscillum pacificum TaxID=392723 RepID=UPI002157154C|nr:DinB family protein [Marinoscillum pacificum]